jgi:C_GCAxxG_C_C family probable redox protein
MSHKDQALACFKQGYSCSQSVVAAFAQEVGLSQDTALKVSAGFGGGMARMGETCGAVTGALLIVGMRFGATSPSDSDSKEGTYCAVQEFCRRFKARNKSLLCRELLGCDISTAEGLQLARESKLFVTQCPKYVGDAAELLEHLL